MEPAAKEQKSLRMMLQERYVALKKTIQCARDADGCTPQEIVEAQEYLREIRVRYWDFMK